MSNVKSFLLELWSLKSSENIWFDFDTQPFAGSAVSCDGKYLVLSTLDQNSKPLSNTKHTSTKPSLTNNHNTKPEPKPEPSLEPKPVDIEPKWEDETSSDHKALPLAEEVDKTDKTDKTLDSKITCFCCHTKGSTNWVVWEKKAVAQEIWNQEFWKLPALSKEAQEQWNNIPKLICVKHLKFSCTAVATKAHFLNKLLKEWQDERPNQAKGDDVGDNQYSKLMLDLLQLFSDHESLCVEATKTAKSKATADKLAESKGPS
ncbi:hypothetical protein RSOLAG22IIIB_09312 [Rhizoctonia solani]|uniref:Uncharacterized protein n=1 Tax=Rhizoctonia solani TaxID=456999 RepID=A0A0K6FXV6_9AGAM|nr:hypothetical protein RSOLAG22IIIB_09312 [Rhizoctonia solani]